MKKIFITIIVVILLGAGYYFISPFFINEVVNETLPVVENTEDTSVEVVKQGQFTGFDKIHTGSGIAPSWSPPSLWRMHSTLDKQPAASLR